MADDKKEHARRVQMDALIWRNAKLAAFDVYAKRVEGLVRFQQQKYLDQIDNDTPPAQAVVMMDPPGRDEAMIIAEAISDAVATERAHILWGLGELVDTKGVFPVGHPMRNLVAAIIGCIRQRGPNHRSRNWSTLGVDLEGVKWGSEFEATIKLETPESGEIDDIDVAGLMDALRALYAPPPTKKERK